MKLARLFATLLIMSTRPGYDLDMRADGSFIEAPRAGQYRASAAPPGGFAFRMPKGLGLIAIAAGSAVMAGLVLSLALVLVPIALGIGLIGYGALRWQMWRMRRQGAAPQDMMGTAFHWARQRAGR